MSVHLTQSSQIQGLYFRHSQCNGQINEKNYHITAFKYIMSLVGIIVRENVRSTAKKRKKSRLFGFSKKRKKRKKT